MATLTLQNWHANDDGTPRAGATVTYKAASAAEPNANPVLGTTTTNASGRWQFTGVADGDYDVYLTDGVTVRFWKGLAALPLTFAKAPVGPVANALTNGDMSVWQRGTSFAAAVSAAYTADRWRWVGSGAGVVTVARDTSVPTVGANAINTPYSLKLTATTADTTIAGGDVYFLDQLIEGYDYRALTNGFALSFWVKAAITGTYCVAFRNKGSDRSYVAEYTISAANTWEYKTVAIAAPPTAGTWDYATGIGLQVMFVLADTTKGATAGSWQAAVNYATNNQVNGMNTGQVFQLALVNLIPGSTAAPAVPLPYEVQLARCQRYCQVYGGQGTAEAVGSGACDSTTAATVLVRFPTAMCAIPTLTVSAAGDWALRMGGTVTCTALALAANGSSTHSAAIAVTTGASLTAGQGTVMVANATANARLTLEANPS